MLRTRLFWFTSGLLINGSTIAYFIHRDLSRDRFLLLAQLKDNFGTLETRVSNLESLPQLSTIEQPTSSVSQDGDSSS